MSQELINRIRKQRQFKKTVTDGKTGRTFTFTCRRPTDQEAGEIRGRDAYACTVCQRFVVGWDGVTENDVVGGGGSDALEFDPLLWNEWCADRPDFWDPLSEAITGAYQEHTKELEDAAKNLQPGLDNAK